MCQPISPVAYHTALASFRRDVIALASEAGRPAPSDTMIALAFDAGLSPAACAVSQS